MNNTPSEQKVPMTRTKFWKTFGVNLGIMAVLNFCLARYLIEAALGGKNVQFFAGWSVGSLIMIFGVTSAIAVLVGLFRGKWMTTGYFILLWILWFFLTALMLSGTIMSEAGMGLADF